MNRSLSPSRCRAVTDSWNMLVRLCTKRVNNEPDSATKHPQQNPRQANLSIQSCTSSGRISTRTRSTSSGCQLQCRSPTWWQTGVETSLRSSPTNLDPIVGDRCRAHYRCCLGHGWWSWHLEGATTRRRVSEWVTKSLIAFAWVGPFRICGRILSGKN